MRKFELRGRNLFKAFLLLIFLFSLPSEAMEGDRILDAVIDDGGQKRIAGRALIRGKDIWVEADSLRSIGVSLRDGPNGKGYFIDISEPARSFGIKELEGLAGKNIALYFPSLVEDKVAYFNVNGLEPLTGIRAEETPAGLALIKEIYPVAFPSRRSELSGPLNEKFSLVWAHITRDNPDLGAEEKIAGLDVISPTWFNLTDPNGGVANRGSAAYAEAAREKGYRLWPLVSNGFSKANTTGFFKNPAAVNLFIARILCYAKLYALDGINIDFENVDESDRDNYVRFLSLLGRHLKSQGLTVSVDVHVPGNSGLSRSHDRASLSKHVDYVMLMAYDEHWRTSPRAGSVASMPWVEQAVKRTIAEGVPPHKLLLGVPFYMRKWEETPIGQGKVKVKASTLTMAESNSLVSAMGLSPVWLSDKGQFFYSYVSNGKTYKVWAENSDSIGMKLALIEKYGLAGTAGWRKGHETDDIWPVIESTLRKQR